MVFNYSKNINLGWKPEDLKQYYPLSVASVSDIINQSQINRGLVLGGTSALVDVIERNFAGCDITFGPRLVSSYDVRTNLKKASKEDLGIIYSRGPSLQGILTVGLPKETRLAYNIIDSSEYGQLGNIEFDSPEHIRRTEALDEIGEKSDKILKKHAKNILGIKPNWITKHTSDTDFKERITADIKKLGGDPTNGLDRTYIHYTNPMNVCEILTENYRHVIQLMNWKNLPGWVRNNLLEYAIGIISPPSIDGHEEMDIGIPYYMGNEESIETQNQEITKLVEQYVAGNTKEKPLAYSLGYAWGNYALSNEAKTIQKINNSSFESFLVGLGAYMLSEKDLPLLQEFEKISERGKRAKDGEKKAIRSEKKKKLEEIWYKAEENLSKIAS